MFQNKQSTDNLTTLQSLELIYFSFLGTFSKLHKATISYVMSVRPSVHTEQSDPLLDGFSWNLMLGYFSKKKSCRVISFLIKIENK